MPKITIIDGNSLFFRAYYATAYPGVEIMRSESGIPTNAIFAFSNMINKIIADLKPGENLFVAFDTDKHNFRHDVLETYKANRKPAPEELIQQFPLVREFLKSMNIFQFEKQGFEGDDIAGTVAKLAEKEGYEVHLYTSDRDFLQLVTKNISVHILKKGLSDVLIMTPELVKETYGFEPLQIIDYKGLRGDSSDNLPGIPGIGEKTAVKLIQDYGNFDNIIQHADDIKGKIGESIKQHSDIGKISRDLAIIQTNIELPFAIEDTVYQGYEFKNIAEFCAKYSLKQFMNKVTPKWKIQSSEEIKVETTIVDSLPEIASKEIGIALDYAGENYTNDEIYGIAISDLNNTYYLNFENAKNDQNLINLLKDPLIKKYCYDYKAIKVCLKLHNIEINGLESDLLIAAYLLDSSLKNNVRTVMNLFGRDLIENEEVSLFSLENPSKTGQIAFFSLSLKSKVINELSKVEVIDLYKNLELPLVDTLADMEIEGFPLDAKTLDSFGDVYKEKAKELSNKIFEMVGEEFNLSSPKQIADILFNKLGLKGNKKMSTSIDVLKELQDTHPVVPLIMEYRKYFKLISTYIDGLKTHIHEDGKIHAKFNQAQTATGRLSSSEPNLQNISVRDEEGKLIRKAFFYPDKNYSILSLDYSQIELRVLASLSRCELLKNVFIQKKDIHAETAKKIFNLSGEPTANDRRKAKTVNFGIVYGISDWGLSDELGISVYDSRQLIDSFYSSYPEIGEFFSEIVNNASNNGYVSTILGRRRYLRELHDSNYQAREFAKRAAINAPIQGSAADLIKSAMIQVNKKLKEGHYKSKMVLQIHDELIFKVPNEEKDIIYKLVKETMEHAMTLDVPLLVDGGYGDDWYSAK